MTLSPLSLDARVPAVPTRIVVPHGHGTVHVRGTLTGFAGRAEYVLHARKGQCLSVFMQKGGPSVVMLTFPNGQHDGAPGGIQDTLPRTGKYRIVITEHRMGEPWHGPFVLRISLH